MRPEPSGAEPPLQAGAAPQRWLRLRRSVRFGDTDAAGVVQFHQLLRWCHEAYEESLEQFGIAAALIFPTPTTDSPPSVALPIVHCSADYRAPLVCGDALILQLEPRLCGSGVFEVRYRINLQQPPPGAAAAQPAAVALTRHVAIGRLDRRRCPLPEPIQRWLAASAGSGGGAGPAAAKNQGRNDGQDSRRR